MRSVLLVLLAAFFGASPARAATVRVDVYPEPRGGDTAQIVFTAAASEVNETTVTSTPGGSWTFHDGRAPVTAGDGCAAVDADTATCSVPAQAAVTSVEVSTGDGDDTIQTPETALNARVDAGGGNDVVHGGGTLAGGDGNDIVLGGSSADWLYGGPGVDLLRGGPGDDTLAGDGTLTARDAADGDDTLDGGTGSDTVSYSTRRAPVVVDLPAAIAGSAGEQDRLVSIENAAGGESADRLTGDDGPNDLAGSGGDDILAGRGGDDVLRDGHGADRLDGGDGNDTLFSIDAGDRLAGGPGADHLQAQVAGAFEDGGDGDDIISFGADPAHLGCGPGDDTIASEMLAGLRLDDCEHIVVGAFGLFTVAITPLRRRADRLSLPVACRAQGTSIVNGCRGHVDITLRRAGERPIRLGRLTFRLKAGTHATRVLRLARRQRRALRNAAHPLLELRLSGSGTVTARGPGGVSLAPKLAARWRVRL